MTAFQQIVYKALETVPPGKVITYRDLATMIGKPKAVRAVGTALGKNKRIGIIPCHRVVRSDGRVGQFALGTQEKVAMLTQEGVTVTNGFVPLHTHRYQPHAV